MTLLHSSTRSMRCVRLAIAAALLSCVAVDAMAQYKIVGPDGHVTYTDKPPTAAQARPGNTGGGGVEPAAVAGGLPYETRQAAGRYPVTLYASKGCVPCDQSRQWLRGHGIPFGEYTVDTNADIAQLQQRFGESSVPIVTMGTQTLKGFSSSELQSYADAAGYPRQARLSGYTWPAPRPLVPVANATPDAANAAPPTPAPTPKIDLPPPSKSGIQF